MTTARQSKLGGEVTIKVPLGKGKTTSKIATMGELFPGV